MQLFVLWLIAAELEVDFYFARPYHSWERGSNENLNGLIRQYIPKTTNILELEESFIQEVEKALNDRPRKRHGYLSPLTIHQQLTKEQKVALKSCVYLLNPSKFKAVDA